MEAVGLSAVAPCADRGLARTRGGGAGVFADRSAVVDVGQDPAISTVGG